VTEDLSSTLTSGLGIAESADNHGNLETVKGAGEHGSAREDAIGGLEMLWVQAAMRTVKTTMPSLGFTRRES
jgi:hypothetical protein